MTGTDRAMTKLCRCSFVESRRYHSSSVVVARAAIKTFAFIWLVLSHVWRMWLVQAYRAGNAKIDRDTSREESSQAKNGQDRQSHDG